MGSFRTECFTARGNSPLKLVRSFKVNGNKEFLQRNYDIYVWKHIKD